MIKRSVLTKIQSLWKQVALEEWEQESQAFGLPSWRVGRTKFQHSQESHHRYLLGEERDLICCQLIELYGLVFQYMQIICLTDYQVRPSKSNLLLFYRVVRSVYQLYFRLHRHHSQG